MDSLTSFEVFAIISSRARCLFFCGAQVLLPPAWRLDEIAKEQQRVFINNRVVS